MSRQNDWRKKNRESGRCWCGKKPLDGMKSCDRCTALRRKRGGVEAPRRWVPLAAGETYHARYNSVKRELRAFKKAAIEALENMDKQQDTPL